MNCICILKCTEMEGSLEFVSHTLEESERETKQLDKDIKVYNNQLMLNVENIERYVRLYLK